MRARWLLPLLLVLWAGAAGAADWQLTGSFKSLDLALWPQENSPLDDGVVSSNRLRLQLTGAPADALYAELAVEALSLYRHPSALAALPAERPGRLLDLEHAIDPDRPWSHQLLVDRASLRWQGTDSALALGRQAIGFGRISIASPLDIIAPFPPDALDTEFRPGVDAFRYSRFWGLGGQVEAVAVAGQTLADSSLLLTGVATLGESDLLLLGGRVFDRSVLGAGWAGQAAGIGLKLEAVGYRGTATDPRRHFAIIAAEAEARLVGDLILTVGYQYHGAGSGTPADYTSVLTSDLAQDGLLFFAGRHYLLVAPSWQAHPLVTLSGLVLWNLEDGSALLRPQASLSLADDLALELFVSQGCGPAPDTTGRPASEYGGLGTSAGLLLRAYF